MPLTKPEEIDGEEAPEPPEPSAPKTEVADREVAVETDAVAAETLREALESQAEHSEQFGIDVFEEIGRVKDENEELKQEVRDLRRQVEELAHAADVYELPCGHGFENGQEVREHHPARMTCGTCGNTYGTGLVIED